MHTMRSHVTQLASLLLLLLVFLASTKAVAATAVIGYMPEYRLGGNYNYVSWPWTGWTSLRSRTRWTAGSQSGIH